MYDEIKKIYSEGLQGVRESGNTAETSRYMSMMHTCWIFFNFSMLFAEKNSPVEGGGGRGRAVERNSAAAAFFLTSPDRYFTARTRRRKAKSKSDVSSNTAPMYFLI